MPHFVMWSSFGSNTTNRTKLLPMGHFIQEKGAYKGSVKGEWGGLGGWPHMQDGQGPEAVVRWVGVEMGWVGQIVSGNGQDECSGKT